MANFQTHITVSTTLGVGIGVGGAMFADYPPVSCALAGGLCGIAGMLPDVDSENGVPLRETMTFLASVVPLMLMERVSQYYGAPLLAPEPRILAAGGMYLFIRFVVAEFIRRTTVHRGMWHSIPAAAIAGLCSFFLCVSESVPMRMFYVVAVIMGYLSHLLLDEIYSVEEHRGRFRTKRSFGTALKLWGPSYPANMFTYGLLMIVGTLIANEPAVQHHLERVATDTPSDTTIDDPLRGGDATETPGGDEAGGGKFPWELRREQTVPTGVPLFRDRFRIGPQPDSPPLPDPVPGSWSPPSRRLLPMGQPSRDEELHDWSSSASGASSASSLGPTASRPPALLHPNDF